MKLIPYWELFSVDEIIVYYVHPPHPHHPVPNRDREKLQLNIELDGTGLEIREKLVYFIADNTGCVVTGIRNYYDGKEWAAKIHPHHFPAKLMHQAYFDTALEAYQVLADFVAHVRTVCERIPRSKRNGSSIGWVNSEPIWTLEALRTGSIEKTNLKEPTENVSCVEKPPLSDTIEASSTPSVNNNEKETQTTPRKLGFISSKTRRAKSVGQR